MSYDFAPGEYVGDGVWRGPLLFCMPTGPVSPGTYELRMFTGTEGTLGLIDGVGIAVRVGNVDLGRRVMTFMSVTYRP
jgi:hypothetical protein